MKNFREMERILAEGQEDTPKLFHDPEDFRTHQRSTRDDSYGSYEPVQRTRYPRRGPHKGSEETRQKLQDMFTNDWHKAINTIHEFLELRAAYDGNDRLIKIFDEFLYNLHRAGMMG